LNSSSEEEEMLLAQKRRDSSAFCREDPEEDEMLFSQGTESSLSIASSIFSSVVPLTPALKRSVPENVITPGELLLDSTAACKLADVTLQVLIGGFKPCGGQQGYRGIQVEKPPPELSLSDIVPAMFSLGFKEVRPVLPKYLVTCQ
jgi:hypothetical protein